MKYGYGVLACLLLLFSCHQERENPSISNETTQSLLNQLLNDYEPLPEKAIAQSPDQRVFAQYAKPTEKYGHGILGDKIEAEQLVVVKDGVFYEHMLPEEYVFEDIIPRLSDVDGDGDLEFITIRSHVAKGGGIAIYKLVEKQLVEFARVAEIGSRNRWLNIVAIFDLNGDNAIELVWIETPHIGGILKVAEIEAGSMNVIAEKAQYSNHAIGERNLCLSVLTEQNNNKVFYVPNQNRDRIVGFTYENKEFKVFEEFAQEVDFSEPLKSQYEFSHILEEGNNCSTKFP